MSEEPRNQNQMVMYLMGGIIVLLVAVVGILVARNNSPAANIAPVPNATAANPAPSGQAQDPAGGQTGAPTGMGGAPAAPANFDPKTATKVPNGMTPKQFVEEYYKAIEAGKWDEAFKHLPADKQASQDVASFKAQIEGYGVNGYSVGEETKQGSDVVVSADQVTTSYGTFMNGWVFTKDGESFVLKSKAVTGMKQ